MYEITLDGRGLFYPGDDDYITYNDIVRLQMNDSGSFECDIPPTNPEYGNIKNRSSVIQVFMDEKEIFSGEIQESSKDFYGSKHIYAVGELAYLFCSVQPQAEYHDLSPRQMLETWLNEHNRQVEDRKKFYIGVVTVHDSNDSLYRYTNYESTLDAIREKLTGRLGGFLRIRKVDGKRYLDWINLEEYGKRCMQEIRFGENLLDYTETVSADNLYTAVIPLGAKIEEETENSQVPDALEQYVDITPVNAGKDYLYSEEAVRKYGWNKAVVTWDDVHVPSILKEKGEAWLRDNQFEEMALELTAVDLSELDQSYDSFSLGDTVNTVSDPYGLDRVFPVREMEINLKEPDKNRLILGDTGKLTYTSQNSDSKKQMDSELEKIHVTSKFLQDAIDNATSMMTGSKGGYKVSEYDGDGKWLRDLYMDAPGKEEAVHVMQINMNGIGFSRTGIDGPYKNAWTIDGVLLGEFIKAHSIQAEALSTEYVTSVEKQIEDAETGAKEWARSTITTSIKALEDSISLKVNEEREYVDGIREELTGRIDVTSSNIALEVTRAKQEETRLGSAIDMAADNISIEVTRAKGAESSLRSTINATAEDITLEVSRAQKAEETLKASIRVNADSIQNTVAKGEIASYLTQYYDRVLVGFNNDSKYVQLTAGQIAIYDNGVADSKKRIAFNQNGNHFYRDGYYVGKIGTNQWSQNSAHKGLVFDLENIGKYMAWGQKASAGATSYSTILCYSRASSIYSENGLHLGCDLYGEGFTLQDVKIGNISAGGYTAYTGDIPIVNSITDNGNGSISWRYSNLKVRNGIVIGYGT